VVLTGRLQSGINNAKGSWDGNQLSRQNIACFFPASLLGHMHFAQGPADDGVF
jgi:hypothetical protein